MTNRRKHTRRRHPSTGGIAMTHRGHAQYPSCQVARAGDRGRDHLGMPDRLGGDGDGCAGEERLPDELLLRPPLRDSPPGLRPVICMLVRKWGCAPPGT